MNVISGIVASEAAPIMDQAEFDQRYEKIQSAKGNAPRDQALARLFVGSGWTQAMIAERIGMNQRWVSYHLTFGKFITFTTAVLKVMTEWEFREFWVKTDTALPEAQRFQQVERFIGKPVTPILEIEESDDAPDPENIDGEAKAILEARGLSTRDVNGMGYARAIVLNAEPHIIAAVKSKQLGLQGAAAYARQCSREQQRSDGIKDAKRKANVLLKGDSHSTGKKKSSPTAVKLTKEEKAQARTEALVEYKARKQKLLQQLEGKDQRPRLKVPDSPVIMYGVQLWPVTEQERLKVGHYDYDQLFFAVHQFEDLRKLLALTNQDIGSQAKILRERLKSLYVFAKRRFEGQSQKEMLTFFALIQKLSDFYRDNPDGERRPPLDKEGVFNGWT